MTLYVPYLCQDFDEAVVRHHLIRVHDQQDAVHVPAPRAVAGTQEVVGLLADRHLQHLRREYMMSAVGVVALACPLDFAVCHVEPLRVVHDGLVGDHRVTSAWEVLPEMKIINKLRLQLRGALPVAAADLELQLEQDMQPVQVFLCAALEVTCDFDYSPQHRVFRELSSQESA